MSTFYTALSLTATGTHPGSWRDRQARPHDAFDAASWVAHARSAEQAGIDLLTLPDAFTHEPEYGALHARLDAVGLAARIAPQTSTIGLVPTVTTTHTEPFHLQAAIATVDWVSRGRAGWQLEVSNSAADAEIVGRRAPAPPSELWREAGEVADVGRRLWDSWEDDAEIRDIETGRFVDRDKLHYVDYKGSTFSVKGPSIVPRPPQGHPVTVIAIRDRHTLAVAAESADVVLLRASDVETLRGDVADFEHALDAAGRRREDVRLFADWNVVLGDNNEQAQQRWQALQASTPTSTYWHVLAVDELAHRIAALPGAGLDGIHLRPAVIATDLDLITGLLLDRLRHTGVLDRLAAQATPLTLRERLGLAHPANQYAAVQG
ncbi:LLM class flavin-dependent oxidoreductase [Epidermidibacterium keratini]|uniref:LLM class flavin-dependent oxidoreductase n=1 Tax=Epidermidibacterium keratini TaxID=1891644 RepID=A0A7L4YKG0_9ACTN|nr:LLM class flavin-dependent oxidoreductase [Epidermidibacterium keratini]QHB99705.1 LLM class flavin-dependent oxidoreductase [Epidermidibacterium keratini]